MMVLSLWPRWAFLTAGLLTVLACDDTKSYVDPRGGPGGGTVAGSSGTGGQGARGGSAGQATAGAGGFAGQADGGVQGLHVATWDPADCHTSPVSQPSDPTAAAQWSAAKAYCESLSRQGCLEFVGNAPSSCSPAAKVDECMQEVLWSHGPDLPSQCEDAWLADIACGAAASFPMFCTEANSLGSVFGPETSCSKENQALLTCLSDHDGTVKVRGTYTRCTYPMNATADCQISCQAGRNSAVVNCFGAEGLPKQCVCALNGRPSYGDGDGPLFVNTCAEAAQQAADGFCTSRLDCCIAYVDAGKNVCACRNPKVWGYDSCQAMADFAKGTIVDICPQFALDTGACWPPNSCSSP